MASSTEQPEYGDYETALKTLVDQSAGPNEVKNGPSTTVRVQGDELEQGRLNVQAPAAERTTHKWLSRFVPKLEKFRKSYLLRASPSGDVILPCHIGDTNFPTPKILPQLASKEHFGNLVATARGENPPKIWESMPIYVRLGMQALYHGREQAHLLATKRVESFLREQSIKQGELYDSPQGALQHIQQFVKTYSIDTQCLLQPNLEEYRTFNEFFYRKLKEGERKVAAEGDERVVSSAADCRLTVFQSVELAKEYWIKGQQFTLANLFQDEEMAKQFEGGEVAIFRLAPADYHRFHSPIKAVVGPTKYIEGQYYTVNPVAVNEDLNVFTEKIPDEGIPKNVAFVQIGAMLVGSIVQTVAEGDQVARGGELGYFAYGGSTVLCVFPAGQVHWDEDLLRNSKQKMETAVKVRNVRAENDGG
ncbi:BZ3500_MvSof-1268-A1-R1_Chr12-3g04010 [Microbotryum saponariae]|uniref:BZ3500_MvSof-1268-A1-R1_Chr12-3g04010 protein n=1 Tax=Microbotryum saponariae TaxID=289078 RepID=A0A2X0L709_9BASI|nr:BZ3500_MvSof-1268-A1-R1_Chr12-3g04010 [Microbotryum saponariae]SDA02531.1 BZ3501_MvSof-1269-A2-R1_Chr12-3g03665 [Microbotryum saponariae]